VLATKIPLTLMPIATGSQLALNEDDLRELDREGDAGRYLSRRSKVWLWFWKQFVKTDGGPIFDAGAVVAQPGRNWSSAKRGMQRMDGARNLLVTRRLTSGARRARYCTSFAPATKQAVMQRLMARRSRE